MADDGVQLKPTALRDARARFEKCCAAETHYDGTVHSVVFQPTPGKINQDRIVVQEWDDIVGHPWSFMAVLDDILLGG